MLGITDFWTYVLGAAAIVLLPGPNSIFVLTTAARRGARTGYRAACGVFLGDTVLMVLSAAGVASLLKAYPPLFLIIKYAGAAYLGWVGLGIIRGALRTWRSAREPVMGTKAQSLDEAQAGAPAAAVPARLAAEEGLSFLILGAVVQVFSVLYLTTLIFSGQFLAAQFRRRRRLAAAMSTGVGTLFVGFGLKLATASVG